MRAGAEAGAGFRAIFAKSGSAPTAPKSNRKLRVARFRCDGTPVARPTCESGMIKFISFGESRDIHEGLIGEGAGGAIKNR
mgnify:CR=1